MKYIYALTAALFIILFSAIPARAIDYDTKKITDSLSDEARGSLDRLGADAPGVEDMKDLSFDSLLGELLSDSEKSLRSPLASLASLIACLLVCSLFYSLKGSAKTTAMRGVLSLCASLCVTLTVCAPILGFIDSASTVIKAAADFSLAYIPALAFALSASGRAVSSASYYGLNIFLGQTVSRASSDLIAPFLKAMLALSVTDAVSHNVDLSGIIKTVSKYTKLALVFLMTLFSSFLSVKQLLGAGADNLSSRAVRLGLSSLVPVVGAALSESYKTVEGSVGLLKSGVGVFALLGVAFTFLPVVLSAVFWSLSLSAGKCVAELLNLREPASLLGSVGEVISSALAVLLSVMTVFIISTAIALTAGGSNG